MKTILSQLYRARYVLAGDGQTYGQSLRSIFSRVMRDAKAYLSRPIHAAPPQLVLSALNEFVAKEKFKRGEDVVCFGDELYKWREAFNISPMFIALRAIESGEEVVSNPSDLEKSD